MKKFLRFCSNFAGAIIMTIGVLAAILWAIQSGTAITQAGAWGHPQKAVESTVSFSIAISGFAIIVVFGFLSLFNKKLKVLTKIGKFIIWGIAIALILGLVISAGKYLGDTTGWKDFPTKASKAAIGIFSTGIILMGMNIVFGVLSIGAYKKQGANA